MFRPSPSSSIAVCDVTNLARTRAAPQTRPRARHTCLAPTLVFRSTSNLLAADGTDTAAGGGSTLDDVTFSGCERRAAGVDDDDDGGGSELTHSQPKCELGSCQRSQSVSRLLLQWRPATDQLPILVLPRRHSQLASPLFSLVLWVAVCLCTTTVSPAILWSSCHKSRWASRGLWSRCFIIAYFLLCMSRQTCGYIRSITPEFSRPLSIIS